MGFKPKTYFRGASLLRPELDGLMNIIKLSTFHEPSINIGYIKEMRRIEPGAAGWKAVLWHPPFPYSPYSCLCLVLTWIEENQLFTKWFLKLVSWFSFNPGKCAIILACFSLPSISNLIGVLNFLFTNKKSIYFNWEHNLCKNAFRLHSKMILWKLVHFVQRYYSPNFCKLYQTLYCRHT